METQRILDCYRRYLKTFNDNDQDIFKNYTTIKDFIESNCTDNELRGLLYRHCLGRNIREIEDRGFKIIDYCPNGWNSSVTTEAYQLIKNIKKHENDYDLSTYAVNFHRFVQLADKQNPYLELYLWYCFNKHDGRLLSVTMDEIEEAAANAIIQENGVEEGSNHNTSTEEETNSSHNDK